MRHQPSAFEQVVQHFPWSHFDRLVRKHELDRYTHFTARKHFLALLGGVLAGQQGLRATATALRPNCGALRLMGGKAPAKSTLSEANRDRPADLFVDLLGELIAQCNRKTRLALREAVRLIDATHLDLGKRMQRWFGLTQGKVAAKLHIVFEPSAQKPVFFAITPAKVSDITAARTTMSIEPGATYVFDLGYYDFAWWEKLAAAGCTFVTRLKHNTTLRDTKARIVAGGGRVRSDTLGRLPERLTRVRKNPFERQGRVIEVEIDTGKTLRLFTNDLTSPAEAIAALYKERWQIELFFKWIKQNLKISKFMGTNENAIRTQVAVSFIAYLLVQKLRATLHREFAPAQILLVLRTHLFVRRPVAALLDPTWQPPPAHAPPSRQLALGLCK
jgi:hypothetical protein